MDLSLAHYMSTAVDLGAEGVFEDCIWAWNNGPYLLYSTLYSTEPIVNSRQGLSVFLNHSPLELIVREASWVCANNPYYDHNRRTWQGDGFVPSNIFSPPYLHDRTPFPSVLPSETLPQEVERV